MLNKHQKEIIKQAVNSFNQSSWVDVFEAHINVDEIIKQAEKNGTKTVLESIRREDIRLFHKEEALCGCI